jgi:hypothetical protein
LSEQEEKVFSLSGGLCLGRRTKADRAKIRWQQRQNFWRDSDHDGASGRDRVQSTYWMERYVGGFERRLKGSGVRQSRWKMEEIEREREERGVLPDSRPVHRLSD